MAEKVEIFELNINVDAAIKDSANLTKSIDGLKGEIKELKEAEEDNSEAIAEKTAHLKSQQAELRTNNNLTKNIITANKAATGSIQEQRAQLSAVSIAWARLSKEERENTEEGKELAKQKLQLTEALKGEEKATGDTRRNVGNYTDSIKDALEGTAGFNTSLLTLAANPIVLTITLIVGLFSLLKKAIDRNEKASENLNKVFGIFKGVLDGILNALGPIVEFLTDQLLKAFESPVESIKNLGNIILENIINRFKAVLVFGDALDQLFKGNFKEAAKLGADAFIQLGTGVENGTDKIVAATEATIEFAKTVVEETDKAIDANKKLANSQLILLRIQKQFELQQLNFQKLAEAQRQIRDDEAKSIDERISANIELGRILDEQLKSELRLANEQLRFAELKQQADGVTLETEEELLDARVKIAEINERIDSQRSEQLTNTNALLKEQEELELAILEAKFDAADQELALEIEKSARITDEKFKALLLNEENRRALQEQSIFSELDLEREKLESQRQQEIAFAEQIGADTTLINKKYAKANEEIARAEFQAKIALAGDFANNIATIAGKNTAVGKAAAVASATINTYQAAIGAYAALAPIPIVGPALGVAAAGAAVVSGLANVKKILSTKSGLPGESGGGGGSSAGGSPSIPSTPRAPRSAAAAGGINEGIVSRDTTIPGDTDLSLQPTLVTDDVTISQNQEAANNQTAAV